LRKLYKKLLFNFFFVVLLYPHISFGAACCGAGFAVPSLITGDEKAQFTSSYTYSNLVARVSSSDTWQRLSDEKVETLKIDAVHIFKDRFQAGISLPIQKKRKPQDDSSTGLSDISAQVGYEYLTDWDYSEWKPRAVGYLSVVFPTGRSIYESNTVSNVDSRGRGFWSLGVGSIFTKNYGKWDFISNIEIHKSFDKSINNQVQGEVQPGYGGSFSFGVGYSIEEYRAGITTAWTYEDPIAVRGTVSSDGNLERYGTATFTFSRLFKNNYSGAISYSDQTILESPSNTTLSRSFAFLIQKKWNR